jgi:hypothetical protein
MRKKIKYLVLLFGVAAFFLFVIFVINQTVQVVNLCHSMHPVFGKSVKYFLLAVYALLLLFSLYNFLLLPRPLKLPAGRNAKGYDEFLKKTRYRLAKNKNLPEHVRNRMISLQKKNPEPQVQAQEIRLAEKELAQKANGQIKETSQAIFISTAISQSGSLDSIVVLTGQIKMVWRIAKIYNQRPALSELAKLYANVAATSFAARAIEDLDFAEIIEPVIRSFSGPGLLNFIPVISILSNSIFNGTTNALLTLRTGIIARKYCSLFAHLETREKYRDVKELKKHIKTSSIRESGKLLGNVIVTPSQTVFNLMMNGLKKSKNFSDKVLDEMNRITKEMISRIIDVFKKRKPAGD